MEVADKLLLQKELVLLLLDLGLPLQGKRKREERGERRERRERERREENVCLA